MNKCPKCGEQTRQIKDGYNRAGSQRYKCQHCEKRYTPEPKPRGYPESLRKQALKCILMGSISDALVAY
jgi:transposase-like protein